MHVFQGCSLSYHFSSSSHPQTSLIIFAVKRFQMDASAFQMGEGDRNPPNLPGFEKRFVQN
jgi:hypothetical protein